MITTISLLNTHTSLSYNCFFSCDEKLHIYSLSNFQIYSTVLLTIVTILYITSPGFIYLIVGNLYLLITFTHFIKLFLNLTGLLVPHSPQQSRWDIFRLVGSTLGTRDIQPPEAQRLHGGGIM